MSSLVAQSEYTPQQMQMLLGELKKQPELQNSILHHVTQNHITDPQAIAALVQERLLAAQQANPFASLVAGLELPKFEAHDMAQAAQLPAPQAVAAVATRDLGNSIA